MLAATPTRKGEQLTLIKPGPDFLTFFQAFEHTAFRLEVRDWYDAPYENESVRKFLAGETTWNGRTVGCNGYATDEPRGAPSHVSGW